ncbi:MAG TPA: putative glycolipid-binding domain-containing protein [Thermoanaerobaculia bacterium]|nr:putative glycolipid-binding domain-containing protein [Thermoanaerobaculia bacterium]
MSLVAPVLWRRLDLPGHEAARLERLGAGWRLAGTAVLAHDGQPCRLDYEVRCDESWRTRSTTVRGWIGERTVAITLAAGAGGVWHRDGCEQGAVAGCLDVDLGFSPATNLLPIRRLGLAVGERSPVRAAWLRFPSLALEPLDQTYHRLAERSWRYESATGFAVILEVDETGMVIDYPPAWRRAAGRGLRAGP